MSKVAKDIVDELTSNQFNDLDEAIKEADEGETISWEEFTKNINDLRRKFIPH